MWWMASNSTCSSPSRRARARASVDLPDPLAPTTAMRSGKRLEGAADPVGDRGRPARLAVDEDVDEVALRRRLLRTFAEQADLVADPRRSQLAETQPRAHPFR